MDDDRPAAVDPRRWRSALAARLRCSPAEAVAVGTLVAGAFAGLGLLWVLASPHLRARPAAPAVDGLVTSERESPDAPALAEAATPAVAAVPTPSELVVHVAGRVAAPGVYRLPTGSRVAEAVAAAGGALGDADVNALNLARALLDGEQVRVPAVGEPPAPALAPAPGIGHPGGGARRPDGTLDLNLATLADLDELPGVGPVLAQRVLDHRTEIGRFTTVDELRDVKGIGEATFADLAPEVSV